MNEGTASAVRDTLQPSVMRSCAMPDWSYHTLFKPLLFRLPAATARKITLGAVSTLGNVPGGLALIDFMGHMAPSASLAYEALGMTLPGRVGLAAGLCTNIGSVKAFQRFGFGFLEAGPVTVNAINDEQLQLNFKQESITCRDAPSNAGIVNFVKNILPNKPTALPVFVRTAHSHGTSIDTAKFELSEMAKQLPAWISALVLDGRWCLPEWDNDQLRSYLSHACALKDRVLLALPPAFQNEDTFSRLIDIAASTSICGISITGGISEPDTGQRVFGRPAYTEALAAVARVRQQLPSMFIVAGEGIIEPADALAMLEAGANVVTLYSGLVFSGPGLPKRINELVSAVSFNSSVTEKRAPAWTIQPAGSRHYQGIHLDEKPSIYSVSSVLQAGWIGFAAIGIGLLITGSSAITVGLTTVILPYDEKYLGMTRDAMISLNSKLLPFLSHDRVTYAGAGMSCGLLFAALSYFGARTGQHWAYIAARNANAFGFLSFLLFLGFHYLDPLHALATLIMLPLFFWGVLKPPVMRAMRSGNLHNSPAWYAGLQGQLLFVSIGAGLMLAGITICKVGTSTVFVKEDLMFMCTTADHLLAHNDHLLPAIAHDRAGFGGALVTAGIAVLLTSLHGFRQGEGWVWWMLLISGLPGFVSTLAIHYAIGYTNWFHLLPAYIASVMFAAGLCLSYRYLCVERGTEALPPQMHLE
jgi:dihydroorotate dehydrogenase